jgi:hypothetical protein
MTSAPAFRTWLDGFFESYYRRRPVNATHIGVHAYDDRLPDYSEAGVGDALADAEALLAGLAALPAEPLAPAEAIDRELAAGFLEIQRWELGAAHGPLGNPCAYTGEAIFGLISLLRRPFAPLSERLGAAAARLEAVPALLAQGRANLRQAPPAWVERALEECAGGQALLGDGLERLLAEAQIDHPALRRAAARASAALEQFRRHLADEARPAPPGAQACGPEILDLLIRRGHFLPAGADAIVRQAEAELEASRAYLAEHAADFGAATPAAALAQLADIHPAAEGYYARYGELWAACKEAAERHGLLTWPDSPIRFMPQPAWARAAAPQLYFLFYHAAPPLDNLPEFEYLVTPVEPDMPAEEQLRRLRATNESVIKLNHVVHHGAIGHHVQNWHAARAASRVGRVAAVDCAARIAMLCGGTMAEGWACYASELMGEFGFLTPLERYAERQTRMRMAARALVDVRLHTGELSFDGAAGFYRDAVGMPAGAARSEATKNSMFPAAALMYLTGTDMIHQLRGELAARPGFSLRAFHDRLLAHGSIPVAMIAESMRAETGN